MNKSIALLLVFLCGTTLLNAQQVCQVKEYTMSDGYAFGSVNHILQAKNDLIWFSSRGGLASFDGYAFESFKTYPGDEVSMGETNINSIHENSLGDVWCKNQDGRFYLFDVQKRRFIDIFSKRGSYPANIDAVSNIYPLKKGVSWITFKDGKCLRIDNYLCKSGDGIEEKKLDCKVIFNVFQDNDQNEWVLTDKGVYVFGQKNSFIDTPFLHLIRQGNNIWLSDGHRKLARYNNPTQKLEYVELPEQVEAIVLFRSIGQDSLALGTLKSGLLVFNTRELSFKQINVDVKSGSANEVFSVYKDKIGDLWMSNRFSGIIHYQKTTEKVEILQSPKSTHVDNEPRNKYMVHENKEGVLWIIPKGGNLCFFDRKDQKLKYHYNKPGDPESIISPFIRYYFIDQNENIWFDNGNTLGKIATFHTNSHLIEKLKGENEIRSLLIDRHEHIWVGAKNHVLRILDKHYQPLGYVSEEGRISKNPISFGANVYGMLEDMDGNIWVGTRFNGIYLFKPNAGPLSYKVEHYVHEPEDKYSLSNNSIYSFYQDKRGRIWIGTFGGGLNLVEKQGSNGFRFLNSNNQLANYPINEGSSVRYITEYKNEVLLIATKNGLISFPSAFENPASITYNFNTRRPNDNTSLSNNDVLYVFVDSRDNIFVLTRNAGINRITSDTLLSNNIQFSAFTERNGLPTDQILSMLESDSGDLWLASSQSLFRYFPNQHKVEYFNKSLPTHLQFSEAVPVKNKKGELFFGTNEGILTLNAPIDYNNSFTPNILFTDITIQGEKSENRYGNMDNLILNSAQRNISIQFAALDYRDPDEIQYQYKLEGFDTNWHNAFKERTATYLNLPPDDYQFIVKSTNSEGVWIDNENKLSIKVKPRFIETNWAWALFSFATLILILVISYVLFVFFKLKLKVVNEQKLTDLKLSFFTELSHELRTPLTLISSPVKDILSDNSISEKNRDYLLIVKSNTDRLLRIVNQLLDFRKIEKDKAKLFVENTDLVSFIKEIMKDFQLMATEKNIQFSLTSESESLFVWIDKDKFEKIIYNLISNSFKYSHANKTIDIRIASNDINATISVVDQGVGILPDKIKSLFKPFETIVNKYMSSPSSGIGLSLVKELTELHEAKIEVDSKINVGTKFTLFFQLGVEHFKNNDRAEILLADTSTNSLNTLHSKEKEPSNDIDSKDCSILIVEDNEELRRYLSSSLSETFKITTAVNGKEGLKKAEKNLPDIIISDVVMPVMDGLDMVAEIKRDTALSHIPIILLSSKNSLDDRLNALENGIEDYIPKPFSSALLLARINNLREQQKRMQHYLMDTLKGIHPNPLHDLEPIKPEVTPEHQVFVNKLMQAMETNMDNTALSVEDIAVELSISRNVLFKKTKLILGISPINFIKEIRIKRAVQLIDSGMYNISEIAYSCGFNDPNYFAKCFKKIMNCSPTEYRNKT